MSLALIETVRIRSGAAPLWYLHLRRLATSCKALGLPLPGRLITPGGGPDRVHRLCVSRGGLEIETRPVPEADGVRLVISGVRHQPYPHKTTDRDRFDRAAAEARARGADDGLMLTEAGFVAEAAIWALFWVEGDRVMAPPLSLGILPSVARARVTELAGIRERRVEPEALAGRPVFVGNAVRGLVPVVELGGRPVPVWPGLERLREPFWA